MEDTTLQPTDLRDVLRPIKARLWLIIICVSLATALTYYHYASQPKQYTASTTLYLGPTTPGELVNPTTSDRETTDLATLVHSSAVTLAAAQILHSRGSAASVLSGVSATPVGGSDFITISAVAGNAQDAAAVANAAADAFVTVESGTLHNQAVLGIAQDRAALNQLPNNVTYSAQREALVASIQQMQALEAQPSDGIEHIDRASPPGAPFAPDPKNNAIYAFAITLMLSIVGAYGLDRLDRRIRRLSDVERTYGHSVLAAVPRTLDAVPTSEGAAVLPEHAREPFRKMRMNLELAGIDRPPRSIVIASAVAREGKSTVTRNLALAYREAGLSVCVVDCDLRRPKLAELLNVPNVPGVTDVIVGDETLDGAFKYAAAGVLGLRTLARLRGNSADTARAGSSEDGGDLVDVGSIVVLPSGSETSNPPVVLGSDQMRTILARLTERFDVVLIDTSPLLAVSDAVPLLSAADGVIVVTRLGLTNADSAKEMVGQIRRVPGANLLGVVANDVSGHDAPLNSYTYGHTRTQAAV